MCVAVKLREAGIGNVVMVEKGDSVGGTWRENTYPGVACDVPSHAYTYSFAPNPDWSGFIAGGAEIHRYFQKVFRDYNLESITRFNETITSCVFENDQWRVSSDQGGDWQVDLLFAATGMLHQPVIPAIAGQESFAGDQFHSASWDHSVELKNKRIAVVGTGSSATQLIPELINTQGAQVSVFQRTPQWIVKLEGRDYSDKQRSAFKAQPKKMETVKRAVLWAYDKGTTALTSQRPIHKLLQKGMAWNAKRFLQSSITDPQLLKKLTPDYQLGCKRVVMNAAFYDAIQKPNARLITDTITSMDADALCTSSGERVAADVIVYATGFNPVAYMRPMQFLGRNGKSIDQRWARKVQAYRSLLIPEFPNFFLMLGPNSPISNYSVIAISEAQADYALKLVKAWREGRLNGIEVGEQALTDWNRELKNKLDKSVWASGGCNSWYLDEDGDPLTWPGSWKQFLASIKQPNWSHFSK